MYVPHPYWHRHPNYVYLSWRLSNNVLAKEPKTGSHIHTYITSSNKHTTRMSQVITLDTWMENIHSQVSIQAGFFNIITTYSKCLPRVHVIVSTPQAGQLMHSCSACTHEVCSTAAVDSIPYYRHELTCSLVPRPSRFFNVTQIGRDWGQGYLHVLCESIDVNSRKTHNLQSLDYNMLTPP